MDKRGLWVTSGNHCLPLFPDLCGFPGTRVSLELLLTTGSDFTLKIWSLLEPFFHGNFICLRHAPAVTSAASFPEHSNWSHSPLSLQPLITGHMLNCIAHYLIFVHMHSMYSVTCLLPIILIKYKSLQSKTLSRHGGRNYYAWDKVVGSESIGTVI